MPTGTLDAPAGLGYDMIEKAITGPLTMTAGIPQVIAFSVQVAITGTATNDPPILNWACFYPQGTSCDEGMWSNEVRYATYAHTVYLPLGMRNH